MFGTNGAIYLAGGFTSVNGSVRQGVARLLPNGDLDPGFTTPDHTFALFVRGLLLQEGGKVVIGGRLRRNGDSTYYLLHSASGGKILAVGNSMARFNADGSLDETFSRLKFGSSILENSSLPRFWFDVLADGRIVVPNEPYNLFWDPTLVGGEPVGGAFPLNAEALLIPASRRPRSKKKPTHSFPCSRPMGGCWSPASLTACRVRRAAALLA